jgi:outer membrane lipoprotein-sorting protein
MKAEKHLERFIKALKNTPFPSGPDDRTKAAALAAMAKASGQTYDVPTKKQTIMERIRIMKPYLKFAVAAAVIIAVVLFVSHGTFETKAIGAQVFEDAIRAAANLKSVHIKAKMRTTDNENFETILIDHDFVSHDLWKEFGNTPKWRIEKAGRIAVMDGNELLVLIRQPNRAVKGRPGSGLVLWFRQLLDPDKLLEAQLQSAQQNDWELALTHATGEDGRAKVIVTIEAKAEGDFTNDYLKNKAIDQSDNRRVYWFDAQTKLLEGLQVYIHTDKEDVLVLEIEDIEYNCDLSPGLFTLVLPNDVIWAVTPKVLPDNEKYANMTPDEAARAFFQACADENWDEVLKFRYTTALDEDFKKYLGGLQIISIGKSFKSGLYGGWFVPYEVKLRNGSISKMNLAVRNDNPAKRYVVDGGISY